MLRYLNSGLRHYGDDPTHSLARRSHWEFQAVVEGWCAPVDRLNDRPPLQSQTLWVFPPGDLHGWFSEPGRPCHIVVAHFDTVPQAVPRTRRLIKSLTDDETDRVRQLIYDLKPDYDTPTTLSPLRIDRAMLELSLIALSGEAEQRADATTAKVAQAMGWFAENMGQRPSVKDLARAVHVSESHLRRLFTRSGAASPLGEMRRLQIDRAQHLIETTELLLSEIAEACGFGSLSDFSRQFKKQMGRAPRSLRDASHRQR